MNSSETASKAARKLGIGVKALRSRKAPGWPPTLISTQEQQVFRWVKGRDLRQYGLDFGLWTRAVVAERIAAKFSVKLGVTAVGMLYAKLGLIPQKLGPAKPSWRLSRAFLSWRRCWCVLFDETTWPVLIQNAPGDGRVR